MLTRWYSAPTHERATFLTVSRPSHTYRKIRRLKPHNHCIRVNCTRTRRVRKHRRRRLLALLAARQCEDALGSVCRFAAKGIKEGKVRIGDRLALDVHRYSSVSLISAPDITLKM